ncbi:MAG: heavy metal translocating P-type ATPase [Oscillospiraceae bacterium]
MSIRKIYAIENLDCANCGAKLEREIEKIENIESVALTFMTKRLSIAISQENSDTIEKVFKLAEKHNVKLNEISKEHSQDIESQSHCNEESCGCSHNHDSCEDLHCDDNLIETHNHTQSENTNSFKIKRLIFAFLLLMGGFFAPDETIGKFIIFFASYIIAGGDVLLSAGKNILKGQVFDENFLMAIATIGAFIIGEYPEGIAVMLFYQVGELFQDWAVDKSRKSISELMNIKPDHANLIKDGTENSVDPNIVQVGDIIAIKTGEKVPLDCVIIEGMSSIDTSAITGESLPRDVKIDDEIQSGTINIGGRIVAKVKNEYKNSTVSKILELVEESATKKSTTEKFITKFAKYYTPAVVLIAILIAVIPPILISGEIFSEWFYRALVFLVISCPCALVISVPLSFFGGIGGASASGILVKGGNYLESLAKVDTIVFDKTGTLTKGEFSIDEIIPKNISKNELLRLAALAQKSSVHPIAKSILSAYDISNDKSEVVETKDYAGKGVTAIIDGRLIAVGNKILMSEQGANPDYIPTSTAIFVACDGEYIGAITLLDKIKDDAKIAISNLKKLGISKTVILSGDNENAVERVKKEINADLAYGKLMPKDKVDLFESLLSKSGKNKKVAFVGDGINDAPVLARADIGIAMGGIGSDAAIEAADIVIMTDEPSKIAQAVKISRKTMQIVYQNIYFALGVKIIVMILGAMGEATMWTAVFADVGVSILAILNAIRTLKIKS